MLKFWLVTSENQESGNYPLSKELKIWFKVKLIWNKNLFSEEINHKKKNERGDKNTPLAK